LSMAVEILFREMDRYQKMISEFEGVDQATWIWQKNKETKEEGEKMNFPEELLFDED
jgi:hypothetical protein